jgi:hypothetical protein
VQAFGIGIVVVDFVFEGFVVREFRTPSLMTPFARPVSSAARATPAAATCPSLSRIVFASAVIAHRIVSLVLMGHLVKC